jgi:NAD+ kinase
MKVAIYGQYYQNSTEPIIRDIVCFNKKEQLLRIVLQNYFTKKRLYKKEYKTFSALMN